MGWDPFKEIKKAVSNVSNTVNREVSNAGNAINSAASAATGGASNEEILANWLTNGLIGYDPKTGGIKAGVWTRSVQEGVGELTGANATRAAMNQSERILAEQRAEAEQLRRDELERLRQQDVNASRAAGRAQSNSLLRAQSKAGNQAYNNLTRDFLGL
jgi:hypothetical protein